MDVTFLPPAEFRRDLADDKSAVLVDVRTPAEFAEGHIPGAVNIDWLEPDAFARRTANFDKDHTYYLYCRSGGRSRAASEALEARGLRVRDLDGGYEAWTADGLPTVK